MILRLLVLSNNFQGFKSGPPLLFPDISLCEAEVRNVGILLKAISLRCHLLRRAYCCPANNSAQEIVGIRYYFVQMPKSFVRSFSLQKRESFVMCRKAAVVYALFWPDCSCAELPAQLTPSVY